MTGARRDGLPININDKDYVSLADANDNGCTFAMIADYIEQNWSEL